MRHSIPDNRWAVNARPASNIAKTSHGLPTHNLTESAANRQALSAIGQIVKQGRSPGVKRSANGRANRQRQTKRHHRGNPDVRGDPCCAFFEGKAAHGDVDMVHSEARQDELKMQTPLPSQAR